MPAGCPVQICRSPARLLPALLAAACLAPSGVAQPTALPASGQVTWREYGYRDWGPELVQYQVPKDCRWRVVTDQDGRRAPVQIDAEVLSFVAALPRDATLQLTFSEDPGGGSDLRYRLNDGRYEVRNQHLALQLPAPATTAYDTPIPLADAVPPILRWRHLVPGGDWFGRMQFVGTLKVRSTVFKVLRAGPAVVEFEARYGLAPAGEYVCRVQLASGMPLAIVREAYDLGTTVAGEHQLLVALQRHWQPQTIAWVGGAGEQLMPKAESKLFSEYVAAKLQSAGEQPPVGGVGAAPAPYPPGPDYVLLEKLVPAGKWGGYQGGVQLRAEGQRIGLVTLSAGSWRRANALNAWHHAEDGLVVSLPIGVRPIRWSLDIADDFSPFSTHEHDPALPRTYGRRVWGLYVGEKLATAQAQFGYIGLDRYKDWLIEVPETATPAAYPGAFFAPEQVQELNQQLAAHPDAAYLRQWFLFGGGVAAAAAHAESVIKRLKAPYQENDFYLVGLSNYRKSQHLVFVNEAEDALACPELPAELRAELRRRLILYAYVMSEPDFNPRGAGVHLGNNNMTINRTLALTYFAGLLPDHPEYAYWLDQIEGFAGYKFASQTSPCGAWISCPTYQLYSPTRALNITQNVLRNRGRHDFGRDGYLFATLRYLADLTVHDPRFDRPRLIPGMGNSANRPENIWGICMAAVAVADPAAAGQLRYWQRQANGGLSIMDSIPISDYGSEHPAWYLPDMAEQPAPLTTTFIPAYGVIFRNGFGSAEETAMLFRAGTNWSHWDTDSLNLILYGAGAPLSPGTGYQYLGGPLTQDLNIYHNRCKVGQRDAQVVFGRVDAAIRDYCFSEQADYAVAEHYYPPEIFADGSEKRWRRQVMFVKRDDGLPADYFVIRDSFPGAENADKWWTWLNLGEADRIAVDGQPFAADEAPRDKVVPVAEMPVRRGQTVTLDAGHGAFTWMWFARPVEVRLRMTATYASHDGTGRETKTVIEIPAGAGEDFHYLIAPLKTGASLPTCTAPAPGVLKVAADAVTDFVFLADADFAWAGDGVSWRGPAGVVRQRPSATETCVSVDPKAGEQQHVALADGIAVDGEGPFTARLDGEEIHLETDGRARVIYLTNPPFIIRPQLLVDGREWMPSWTDYPASGWGSYRNTWLIALSVPAGAHHLVVRDTEFRPVWRRQFELEISAD